MLKDSNIDPTLLSVNESNFGANPDSIFGKPVPNSPNHANSINPAATINMEIWNSPVERGTGKTPRSTHKVVTPLRKQNSSFLVASLESIFTDSQGVSEQIAKITSSANFKSPASNLASSFATLCSVDSLSDPTLLQSHVQRSLESSAIGLESPYNHHQSIQSSASVVMKTASNSVYNTPLRCKQSRSHDFSDLPSQQRIKKRRSSILAQEEIGDLTSLLIDSPDLSDLSHFKDNSRDDEDTIDVITTTSNSNNNINSSDSNNNNMLNDFDDDYNCFDDEKNTKCSSASSETAKKPKTETSFAQFVLPSTEEYQDGRKPPFSYASLIAQAIIASPKQRLALSNIYNWIMDTYPYYKSQTCGWQNSIRHNLSLNKCFKKIPRDDDEPGKGAYWTVDLDEMDDFEDGMFKRRRSSNNSSCVESKVASNCNSYMNSPKCNNAFLHGTGWSPLATVKSLGSTVKTPNKVMTSSIQSATSCAVPMTPLTMSSQFKATPQKKSHSTDTAMDSVLLTPKMMVAKNSPYACFSTNKIPQSDQSPTANPNPSATSSSATFWSYPNLSLSQLGLDAEPPVPESDQFYNIFNCDSATTCNNISNNKQKLPELFQGTLYTTTTTTTNINNNNNEKDLMTRMSPLSWLLSVGSQDTSLGLFDQSQQILSEYLSLQPQ